MLLAADSAVPSETLDAFERRGAHTHVSQGPRGARLFRAAAAATHPVLLFLHADTILPCGWQAAVEKACEEGFVGGAFRLSFSPSNARLEWVAAWANLRTRLTRVPYGDQAPFVKREAYLEIGGHKPWPLLEDVEFASRLKHSGRVTILRDAVETSPRRYLTHGIAGTVLSNWWILARYHLGADIESLAKTYRSPARR